MATSDTFRRLLRDPLIHFLLIGAAIYGSYSLLEDEPAQDDVRTVVITQEEIKALTEQWTRLWQRPPTGPELADLLRQHVRTQILYREALAMGLDRQDPVIERRLAQKVELLSRSLVTPEPPPEDVLATWYADNADQFREPDRYTLHQLFFDPDRRGDATVADATAALETLAALPDLPEDLSGYGDDSIMQKYYPGRTELELRKLFGSGFTDQVVKLEPGRWHGPIRSGFGVHLVYVDDVLRPTTPDLADIRDRVQEAWMLEQVEQRSQRFLDELVSRYEVDMEATEVPLTCPGQAGE